MLITNWLLGLLLAATVGQLIQTTRRRRQRQAAIQAELDRTLTLPHR